MNINFEDLKKSILALNSYSVCEKGENLLGIDYKDILYIERTIDNQELINGIIQFTENDLMENSLIELNFSESLIIKTTEKIIKLKLEDIKEILAREYSSGSVIYLTIITSDYKYGLELCFPTYLCIEDNKYEVIDTKKYKLNYNTKEIIDNIISKLNYYIKKYENKKESLNKL